MDAAGSPSPAEPAAGPPCSQGVRRSFHDSRLHVLHSSGPEFCRRGREGCSRQRRGPELRARLVGEGGHPLGQFGPLGRARRACVFVCACVERSRICRGENGRGLMDLAGSPFASTEDEWEGGFCVLLRFCWFKRLLTFLTPVFRCGATKIKLCSAPINTFNGILWHQ